ncbi:MAG: DUF3822 family protein [Flavobacteriia bacterium]|nr:DUF3822 family protein [Flavobacteriia bacterium]
MKKHLAIQISENAVYFNSIHDELVTEVDCFFFKDKIDYRYKEQLEQFFLEKKYKEREYDEYSLSWHSALTTLVPNNVFSETNPESIFRLCFSADIPSNHIDYNRIPELSIVNVFMIPLWVKSFFVIKFPRIIIQHEGSYLIRSIFRGNTFNLQTVITIHQDTFNLIITQKNEIIYYSNFNYINCDDIIYHLVFSLQQHQLMNEKNQLLICHGIGASESIVEETITNLKKLKEFDRSKIENNNQLLIKSHIQCV